MKKNIECNLKYFSKYLYKGLLIVIFNTIFFRVYPFLSDDFLTKLLDGRLNHVLLMMIFAIALIGVLVALLIKRMSIFNNFLLTEPIQTLSNSTMYGFGAIIGVGMSFAPLNVVGIVKAIIELRYGWLIYLFVILFVFCVDCFLKQDMQEYHRNEKKQ